MKTKMTDIKTKDGNCDVFIAYPGELGAYSAVLFYMDAFGPRACIYEMVKTLAARGFYVLLPNLFYRVRKAPVIDMSSSVRQEDMPALIKQVMPLIQSYTPELVMRDARQ